MNSIGERIRFLRKKANLSMAVLAKEINCSSGQVSDWENENKFPSAHPLIELSRFFNVSTDWILKGVEPVAKVTLFDTQYDLKFLDNNLDQFEKDYIEEYIHFALYKKEIQRTGNLIRNKKDVLYRGSQRNPLLKVAEKTVGEYEFRSTVQIPILGTAAAGIPIEVVRFVEGYLNVPVKHKDCFVVKVKGDSMKNIGIINGGYAIVRQQSVVENNEIALVMIDNHVTIKRFRLDKDEAILISENDDIQPMVFKKDKDMRILGKVMGFVSGSEADIIPVDIKE
jgi:SOS-response transcriptional repressor LexA/DNA-binding XRE family transcriptional regulator